METQINPESIKERAEAVTAKIESEAAPAKESVDAAAKAAADKIAADKVIADSAATKVATDAAKPKEDIKVEPKVPNDPIELRKWNTRLSQENAAIKEEIKSLRLAIEKTAKKAPDYKELAKNPDALQKQIELERQEAIAEMQDKLQEATTRAVANETTVERIKREQDITNYPEWKRVFPLIQNLAANTDGRINFNQAPSDVLDALYQLAVQLAPTKVEENKVAPVVTGPTEAEIAAKVAAAEAAAEKRGFEKAQEAAKAEKNGAGIGSTGKGGRRDSGVSKDALQKMPLADLKKLISAE